MHSAQYSRPRRKEILEQIPAGAAHFRGTLRDPRAILQRILERIARVEYDTWVAVAPPTQLLLRRRHLLTYLETFDRAKIHTEGDAQRRIRERLMDLRNYRDLGGPERDLGEWQFERTYVVIHKFIDSTFELLSRIAVALEVTDNWSSLDDPDDGAEIGEPVPVLA